MVVEVTIAVSIAMGDLVISYCIKQLVDLLFALIFFLELEEKQIKLALGDTHAPGEPTFSFIIANQLSFHK